MFFVPNNSHVLKYFEDGMKNNTQSVPSRVEIQDGMLEIRQYYYQGGQRLQLSTAF